MALVLAALVCHLGKLPRFVHPRVDRLGRNPGLLLLWLSQRIAGFRAVGFRPPSHVDAGAGTLRRGGVSQSCRLASGVVSAGHNAAPAGEPELCAGMAASTFA